MARQHTTPIFLDGSSGHGVALRPISTSGGAGAIGEATIQQLVHDHPACLPIHEVDPVFRDAVAICRELSTPAGAIDNLLVTPAGLPVLVECKLWRNPEGRREVVGQILDYAKELSRWSAADLQREVRRRLGREGNPLLDLVRAGGHEVDEVDFNDALTVNLRRGRFLLLIVGDGIREGVEAITEYLQRHAGLHFSLGLVELPIYELPGGARLVTPRVLARTQTITRNVVAVGEGMAVQEPTAPGTEGEPPLDEMIQDRVRFWTTFVEGLRLDDPEQPLPKPGRQGYVALMMPAPSGSCWITVFRNVNDARVGLFLSYTRNTVGERAVRRIVEDDWEEVKEEIGGHAQRITDRLDRTLIQEELGVATLDPGPHRERALQWLRERSNAFVNALRPRIRAAVADIIEEA
jgi:hypothetical protein